MSRSRIRIGALTSLMLAAAVAAHAHQYWLAASDYAPAPGQVVEIRASAGTSFRGEAKPWSPERCVGFTWRGSRSVPLAPGAVEGDVVWARVKFSEAGGAWVEYRSNFASIELPAAEFDEYLREEGLDDPLAARRKLAQDLPGREHYRRCCKAWLAGPDAHRAMEPLGQPLELVPLSPPGAARLDVRVLWQGLPLPRALVQTWQQPWGSDGRTRALIERDSVAVVQAERTDERGQVSLDTREPGEWLVSVVHMQPSEPSALELPAADWESTWASLTFARRAPDARARSPR